MFNPITGCQTLSRRIAGKKEQLELDLRVVRKRTSQLFKSIIRGLFKQQAWLSPQEYFRLKQSLQSWCAEKKNTGEYIVRQQAAETIQKCYNEQGESLDLSCYYLLTSIPDLSFLTHLTSIDFSSCISLTSIPNLRGLTKLTKLNFSDCVGLSSIEALRDLTHLTSLNLHNCKALTSIEVLGDLTRLTYLSLSCCHCLTWIPDSLAQLPEACVIDFRDCRFTAAVVIDFQGAQQRVLDQGQGRGPTLQNLSIYEPLVLQDNATLETVLQRYKELAAQIPSPPSLDVFDASRWNCDEQESLRLFLIKILSIEDFKYERTKNSVILQISQSLQMALQDSNFREEFITLINEALGDCGDRVAITLNRIEVQRQLYTLPPNTNELITRLVGYRRLQLLHEFAAKIIKQKGFGDHIEVMLYLQIKLREILQLPLLSQGMLHPRMAHVSEGELSQIQQEVLDRTSKRSDLVKLLTIPIDTQKNPTSLEQISKTNPWNILITNLWEKHLRDTNPTLVDELQEIFMQEPTSGIDADNHRIAQEDRRKDLVRKYSEPLVTAYTETT